VAILLNRVIHEEKKECIPTEGRLDYESEDDFSANEDNWHMNIKHQELPRTPPLPRRKKKATLDQFNDEVPSPYSPTSFSKVRFRFLVLKVMFTELNCYCADPWYEGSPKKAQCQALCQPFYFNARCTFSH